VNRANDLVYKCVFGYMYILLSLGNGSSFGLLNVTLRQYPPLPFVVSIMFSNVEIRPKFFSTMFLWVGFLAFGFQLSESLVVGTKAVWFFLLLPRCRHA
jgi:hypothetical protein